MGWYESSILLINPLEIITDYDKTMYGDRFKPGINNSRSYFEIENN